jgi:hypothetical protein
MLNEIEYLNWLIGWPYNMSMAITVKGHIDKEKLKESLEKFQKKHPLLQSRLDVNKEGRPFLIFGVNGLIPLEIIPRTDDDHCKRLLDKEFNIPFETGMNCPSPLIRVKLLTSEAISDIIITVAHVIGDGMSMVYLFRDLIFFLVGSKRRIKPLDVIIDAEDILPQFYRSKIPKTARNFKLLIWILKKLVSFRRFIRKLMKKQSVEEKSVIRDKGQRDYITRDWTLTEEQSESLIRNCKDKGVSVHSALCTMFLPDFSKIYTPVDLRKKLAYPVGESFGCYAGIINIKSKYKENSSFWSMGREYHEKLTKILNSDEVFKVYKLITRAVPFKLFNELISLSSEERDSIYITNLGSLDKFNEMIASKRFTIKMLYGGVSPTHEGINVLVFTIDKKIHFQLYCLSPPHTEEEIEKYITSSLKNLSNAINL